MKSFETLKKIVLPVLAGTTLVGGVAATAVNTNSTSISNVKANAANLNAPSSNPSLFALEPYIYTPEYQYFLLPTYNLDEVTSKQFMRDVKYSDGTNTYTISWPALVSRDGQKSITFQQLFIDEEVAQEIAKQCGANLDASSPVVENKDGTWTNNLANYSSNTGSFMLTSLLKGNRTSNTNQQMLAAILMNPFIYSANADTLAFTGHTVEQDDFYQDEITYEPAYKNITGGIDVDHSDLYTLPVGVFSGFANKLNSDSSAYTLDVADNHLSTINPQAIYGYSAENTYALNITQSKTINIDATANNMIGTSYQPLTDLSATATWTKSASLIINLNASAQTSGFVFADDISDFNEILYQAATVDGKDTNYWPSHIYNDGFTPYKTEFKWVVDGIPSNINDCSFVEFMIYGLGFISSMNCDVYNNGSETTYSNTNGKLDYTIQYTDAESNLTSSTIELSGLNESMSGVIWTVILIVAFGLALLFAAKKLYRLENPKVAKPKKVKKNKEQK